MICWPGSGEMTELAAIKALQAENARLVALLESHGIAWRVTPTSAAQQMSLTARSRACDLAAAYFRFRSGILNA